MTCIKRQNDRCSKVCVLVSFILVETCCFYSSTDFWSLNVEPLFLPWYMAGHPALIGRHRPFPVTHQAAERWLHHMQLALDATPDIDDDSKIKMMNFFRFIFLLKMKLPAKWLHVITINIAMLLFFRHTAYFLVAGDELKNQNQQIPCKHAAGKDNSWFTKLYKFSFVFCLTSLTFNQKVIWISWRLSVGFVSSR